MLIEELRPRTLDDVIGQELTIKILKGFIKKGKLPHMLFHGSPGTGKTTSALALAQDLYGKQWKQYFIELNASDERGIDTVKGKIKEIAKLLLIDGNFKILFLDEVDSLTKDGQNALRRMMEQYSDRTVFILSCNYKNKLIEPLQNRCVDFHFHKLSFDQMNEYIKRVCNENNIDIKPKAIETLAEASQGSVRTILNTIEKFIATDVREVYKSTVESYTNKITDSDMITLIELTKKKDTSQVDAFIDNVIISKGYQAKEVLERIRVFVRDSKLIYKKDKPRILKLIGDIDFRINEGATTDIQLKTLFVYLISIIR
jgi:replication factor C small subunit